MTNFASPIEIPKRISLSAQAAASIRKSVAEGVWTESLPSERQLCALFQVSRPTIRTALHLLAKQGLLEIHQGRRHRLLRPSSRSAPRQERLIGLVTHEPLEHMSLTSYHGITEMRTHLAEHGFSTELLVCPLRNPRAQCRRLEEFVRQRRVFCCVLTSVSREVQSWFSAHSVPALVLGSCHPEVKLPSLDVDYRSVCRHATGVLLAKGHRRVGLVVPNSGIAGDLASEEGFRQGLERTGRPDVRGIVVRHNGTAPSVAARLDALLASPERPTALIVAKSRHTFMVLMHLLHQGIAVPDRMSIIARDHDRVFDLVSPAISHYAFASESMAHRLTRLMLQLVDQGYLGPEPNLIVPAYRSGGTVADAT